MEPGARGRSPVSRRVAQKLGGDTIVCIPYRPRKDAAYVRETAAADRESVTSARRQRSEADLKHPAAADALSLSGTTPPSSPRMAGFPARSKSMTPESTKAGRPQLVLVDSQGKVALKDRDDASYRKHHRGIGSIDSLLSSTTCVNTQSECSRPESSLSRDIHIEAEDADGGAPLALRLAPRKQASRTQLAPPSTVWSPPTVATGESEDQQSDEEEARLVNEISSWVLRNTLGKDVDDCPAPLLVWDCTNRYLQELRSVALEGNLGYIQTTSGHGTPSSRYGGTPASANNDQQSSGQQGKGKRKADGEGDDGSGLGGRDNQGNDDRDVSPASQAYSTKGSVVTNFSCPYRKRNPLRFNVRDHYVCATHSFADMSQLKKHIRAHHPPVQRNAGPFLCPRCCQGFSSKNELDSHLRQLDVCHISYDSGGSDPEDGITQKIISSLEARSLKAKIDNWVSLWKLLFPADQVIPDPVFVPVMEIFDFVAESKKFLGTLKDLLELQYRHVLEGANQVMNVDLKIHQGLERSAKSIYTWIETVVQDWEQRISGTVSLFTSSAISQSATSDSWASTPQLPPSPAPTPTVVPGNVTAASSLPGSESPGATAPAGLRGTSVRRRPNPPPKRIKRPEILPKAPRPTQIPMPTQRARTPQPQAKVTSASFRPPAPPVLASQSVALQTATTQAIEPGPPYQPSWDHPSVTVDSAYSVPYTSPPDVFPHPAMTPTHYAPMHPDQLEVQSSYLAPERPAEPVRSEALQRDVDPRPQSTATIHANRLTMSTTPRSSLASLSWIRDENRDSSQTLVEAHPPGRCGNMYCPSCSKTLPDDMVAQPSPVGIHPVTGAPHHHPAFHTAGTGPGGPFQTSPSPGEVHGFADQVEWSFPASGGIHGAGKQPFWG
ncbi:859c1dd6-41d9-455e-a6a6-56917532f9c8 [Thermothielavioides terrestris]|uniref:859c1dd6-41d9-455e-a6a6-56917532f9c8 n=1 Tax=Thermothielavioides terrestris TaxID=2587410 RepID=A0A446BSL6_9PEZI|nr:859c1dd6-41d9-455e-a6a6-56917532f9c8 [Thermothielavioides terrestris]